MKLLFKTHFVFALTVVAALMSALASVSMNASIAQAGDFSLVGTGTLQKFNFTNPTAGTTYDSSSKMGYGAGILMDHRLEGPISLQLGVLYLNQQMDISGNVLNELISRHLIQIPLTLQLRLLPHLSIGGGAYYSHSISNNTVTDSSGNVSQESDSAAQLKSYDIGAMGNVALHLPLTYKVKLLADARYVTSFVNQDTSGSVTSRPQGYEFLVGLTFAMSSGGGRY